MNWKPRSQAWQPVKEICRWTPGGGKHLDVFSALDRLPPARPKIVDEVDLYDAATERQRQIYQESCRIALRTPPAYTPMQPGGPEYCNFLDGICYEMARFRCSPGQSGFVKGIWTSITGFLNPPDPPTNGGPFNPYLNNANPAFPQSDQFRYIWYLRLTQQDDPINSQWISCYPSELPGSPFTEMNQWSDARFLWGSPQSVWFLVPRGFYLRLFLHFVANGDRCHTAGAKLWGFTQPATSQAALKMAREGWI